MDYRIDKILKEIEEIKRSVSKEVDEGGYVDALNIYDYEKIPRRPRAVFGNVFYGGPASGFSGIGYSEDYGKTFVELSCPVFKEMHITRNHTVYGFVDKPEGTEVWRSKNWTDFTKIDLTEFGKIGEVHPYGFDSNGDVFIFGEKKNLFGAETETRIFKTTNGGDSFSIALTLQAGHTEADKIGHLHNIDYLGGAPIYDVPHLWLLTTGDANINIKWYKSEDNGDTWELIPDTNDQKFRTVNMNRVGDKLLWSSDAVPGTISGIFTADLDNVAGTVEMVQPLPLTSWGCSVRAKGICVTSREGAWKKDGVIYIYATNDSGKTWQVEKELPIDKVPGGGDIPGFHQIIGPDGEGSYYLTGHGLRDVGSFKVKNKPRYFIK